MKGDEKLLTMLDQLLAIVSNIAVILTNRSWTDNIFNIIATPNKAVLWVAAGAVFLSDANFKYSVFSGFIPVSQTYINQYCHLYFSGINNHHPVRNISNL